MTEAVHTPALATFAPVGVETKSAEEAALIAVAADGHCFRNSAGGGGEERLEKAQSGGVSQCV